MKALFAKTFTALAALSLAAPPVLAAPGTAAQKLSVTRAATQSNHANGLHGKVLVGAAALAAVVAGVIIIVATDKKKHPRSP